MAVPVTLISRKLQYAVIGAGDSDACARRAKVDAVVKRLDNLNLYNRFALEFSNNFCYRNIYKIDALWRVAHRRSSLDSRRIIAKLY